MKDALTPAARSRVRLDEAGESHGLRWECAPLLVAVSGNPSRLASAAVAQAFDRVMAKPVDVVTLEPVLSDAAAG